MSKRAKRRHDLWRKYRARQRYIKWAWKSEGYTFFLKHTATPCSCPMCRNPRRNTFDSLANRLTVGERKANERYKYDLRTLTEIFNGEYP